MIAKVCNQLGNQMFIYASTKSIAIEKGYSFGYILEDTYLNNSFDSKYGNTIYSIFKNTSHEYIEDYPFEYVIYDDYKHKSESNFHQEVYECANNTIMVGLFQTPLYFHNHFNEVKQWFQFPEDVYEEVSKKIDNIYARYPGHKIVSIHFRQGNDYQKLGYAIGKDYYIKSIKKIKSIITAPIVFVVLGDVIPKYVDCIMKKENVEYIRGSLVSDMCFLTRCDYSITSNSTFSWWGSYLSEAIIVIRPSKFYAFGKSITPEDIFPSSWISITAHRSLQSFIFGRIVNYNEKFRNCFKYKYPDLYNRIIKIVYRTLKIKRTNDK